jgi:hypothetical protein
MDRLSRCQTVRMASAYWIDLFTVETWQEFLDHGGDISGFSEKRRAVVSRIRPGDYLLCYLTGISRWIGLLEVVGELFFNEEPIWSSKTFPCRVRVKAILALAPEYGVPVLDMRGQLSVFEGLDNPNHWQGPFRASPTKWKTADGEVVVAALKEAQANPVERPLPKRRNLVRKASLEVADLEGVIPEDDDTEVIEKPEAAASAHTEIQYLLAKLGADMGFDVHIARNDLNRTWRGHRLGDISRCRDQLPQQFDPVTNRTS